MPSFSKLLNRQQKTDPSKKDVSTWRHAPSTRLLLASNGKAGEKVKKSNPPSDSSSGLRTNTEKETP